MRGAAAFSAVLAMLVVGAVAFASPIPTPPREIIAKIYNPTQRRNLAAVTSYILSGTERFESKHGTVTTYWKAPNRFVIVTKFSDEALSYAGGFNGHRGWYAHPGGDISLLRPEDEVAVDCSGMWLSNSDWFPQRWPTTVRYVGWTYIQGTPAILVDVTLKTCGKTRYPYDAKTLRPIFQNRRPDGRISNDRNAPVVQGSHGLLFQAFHEVDERGVPYRGSIWYNSIRVNVPLDDAMFEVPRCWGQCRP